MNTLSYKHILIIFLLMFSFLSKENALYSTAAVENPCEPQKQDLTYVPFSAIMAGQHSMSLEVIKNIANNLFKPGFYKVGEEIKLCYGQGQSPFNKAFGVVLLPASIFETYRYMLYDGHHTIGGVITALKQSGMNDAAVQRLLIPVKIDKQYQAYSSLEEFWAAVKKAGLVYIEEGKTTIPQSHIITLPDNPYRAFLEQTAVGCSESKPIRYNMKDPRKTLWLRVGGETANKSPNFVEYHLEKALKAKGFKYHTGQDITETLVMEARNSLKGVPSLMQHNLHIVVMNQKQEPMLYSIKNQKETTSPEEYCKSLKEQVSRIEENG